MGISLSELLSVTVYPQGEYIEGRILIPQFLLLDFNLQHDTVSSGLFIAEPSLKRKFACAQLRFDHRLGRVLNHLRLLLIFPHLALPHSVTSLDHTAVFNLDSFLFSSVLTGIENNKPTNCPRRKNPPIKAGMQFFFCFKISTFVELY